MKILLSVLIVLSLGGAMAQPAITAIEAVSQMYSLNQGRVHEGMFDCLIWLNGSSSNSSIVPDVTVVPHVLFHDDRIGDIFTASSCAQATVPDLKNWNIAKKPIPQQPSSDGDGTVYSISWPFCYYSRRVGEETIMYRCETSNGINSVSARIAVKVDAPLPATGGFYFGMAPFVFIFAFVLLCNIVLYRRMRARRLMRQHLENQLRQNQAGRNVQHLNPALGGLTPEALARMPTKQVNEADSLMLKEICVICQSEYVMGERYKELNCTHRYHAGCIDAWLAKSAHCPICIGDVCVGNVAIV